MLQMQSLKEKETLFFMERIKPFTISYYIKRILDLAKLSALTITSQKEYGKDNSSLQLRVKFYLLSMIPL